MGPSLSQPTAAGKHGAVNAFNPELPASTGQEPDANQEGAAGRPRRSLPADFKSYYGLRETDPVVVIPFFLFE